MTINFPKVPLFLWKITFNFSEFILAFGNIFGILSLLYSHIMSPGSLVGE